MYRLGLSSRGATTVARASIIAALAVGGVMVVRPARAEIVTISYTGTISGVSIDGVIPGSGANYLGATISGQVVLDTSGIKGAILNYSDFDPAVYTTMVGNADGWLSGTVSVASQALSAAIAGSTNSELFYPGPVTNPPGVTYAVKAGSTVLRLELGSGYDFAGFAPTQAGPSSIGRGEYSVLSSTNPNDLNYLAFSIDTLTSTIGDPTGPGYTDPSAVPIIGSTSTICSCYQIYVGPSVPFVLSVIDEPRPLPILASLLIAVALWRRPPRLRRVGEIA